MGLEEDAVCNYALLEIMKLYVTHILMQCVTAGKNDDCNVLQGQC
jgi:hypothetical protein